MFCLAIVAGAFIFKALKFIVAFWMARSDGGGSNLSRLHIKCHADEVVSAQRMRCLRVRWAMAGRIVEEHIRTLVMMMR